MEPKRTARSATQTDVRKKVFATGTVLIRIESLQRLPANNHLYFGRLHTRGGGVDFVDGEQEQAAQKSDGGENYHKLDERKCPASTEHGTIPPEESHG